MRIREILKASGLPRLDTELLLAHTISKPRAWLTSHDDQLLSETEIMLYEEYVARRKKGEPVAYIKGEKEFFGRIFEVSPDVLIPRPATEELVACALDFLQNPQFIEREVDTGITILCVPLASGKPEILIDVGTGSGCIAATLALEGRKEKILAVDTSEAAIDIAKRNFSSLEVDIATGVGDGPAFVHSLHKPFMIISNPPYIPEGTILEKDVKDFEPHEALFAGKAGMDVLTSLALAAEQNPSCLGIALELETNQVIAVKRFLGVM